MFAMAMLLAAVVLGAGGGAPGAKASPAGRSGSVGTIEVRARRDRRREVTMAAAVTGLPPDGEARPSRLVARRRAESDPARLAWAIKAARTWLGPEVEPAPGGMRRHQADLRLRVSDRPSLVTFGKAAYVDLGPVQPLDDGWQVEVSWRASTLAPLFPVFSGTIVARGGELTVSGWYAPPGGVVGRVADHALLHLAAKGTARWLLGELDRAAAIGAAG
jgi:hypothetical protein